MSDTRKFLWLLAYQFGLRAFIYLLAALLLRVLPKAPNGSYELDSPQNFTWLRRNSPAAC